MAHKFGSVWHTLEQDHIVSEDLPNDHSRTNLNADLPNDRSRTNLNEDLPNDHSRTNLIEDLPNDHSRANLNEDLPNDHSRTNLNEDLPNDHSRRNLNDIVMVKPVSDIVYHICGQLTTWAATVGVTIQVLYKVPVLGF